MRPPPPLPAIAAADVPDLPAARSAMGDPLLLRGAPLHVSTHGVPFLHTTSTAHALLAADGSVIRQGPALPLPPLTALLPPHIPYLVNKLGTPYGIGQDGSIHPLVVSPKGELWWGPDGQPLMMKTEAVDCITTRRSSSSPAAAAAAAAVAPRALLTAAGDALAAPQGCPVGVRVAQDSNQGAAAPATAIALVDLRTRATLTGPNGSPLMVNPATLELVYRSNGQPWLDGSGRPYKLEPVPAEALYRSQHKRYTLAVMVLLLVGALLLLASGLPMDMQVGGWGQGEARRCTYIYTFTCICICIYTYTSYMYMHTSGLWEGRVVRRRTVLCFFGGCLWTHI
jgi:hypothetical protein